MWYFAVNKPKGYLCANASGKDGTSKLVIDLFEVRHFPEHVCTISGVFPSADFHRKSSMPVGLMVDKCHLTGVEGDRVEEKVSRPESCATAAFHSGAPGCGFHRPDLCDKRW